MIKNNVWKIHNLVQKKEYVGHRLFFGLIFFITYTAENICFKELEFLGLENIDFWIFGRRQIFEKAVMLIEMSGPNNFQIINTSTTQKIPDLNKFKTYSNEISIMTYKI